MVAEKDAMPMFLCTSAMVAQTPMYESSAADNVEGKLNSINNSINSVIEMIKSDGKTNSKNEIISDNSRTNDVEASRIKPSVPTNLSLGETISVGDINFGSTTNEVNDWTKVTRRTPVERFGKTTSVSLVVSGLDKNVRGLQVAQFLANKDIEIDDWTLLTKREDATFNTFRIAVKPNDVDKNRKVDDWPDDVQIREYKPPSPRNRSTKNNRQQWGKRKYIGANNRRSDES